jgi:hypothetical protein
MDGSKKTLNHSQPLSYQFVTQADGISIYTALQHRFLMEDGALKI